MSGSVPGPQFSHSTSPLLQNATRADQNTNLYNEHKYEYQSENQKSPDEALSSRECISRLGQLQAASCVATINKDRLNFLAGGDGMMGAVSGPGRLGLSWHVFR